MKKNRKLLVLTEMMLVATQVPCPAQDTFYNYVVSELWLDSLGTNKVSTV